MSIIVKKISTAALFCIILILMWHIFAHFHSQDFRAIQLPRIQPNGSFMKSSDNSHSIYPEKSESSFCQNKTRIMFTKNVKVAGSTISSILIQIATHYHKYEILVAKNLESYLKDSKGKHGYLVTHKFLKSLTIHEKLFPKKDFLWISTTRKVADQVISQIKFAHLQNFYTPKKFDETLKQFKKNGRYNFVSDRTRPFWNGGSNQILYQCRPERNFEKFKLCAVEVFKEFDLIIPVDRLDEGLIMLHKMTCLPLSDFAYTKKKLSSEKFSMSPENMSALLAYHEQSIWFYNYASTEFAKQFHKFQDQFCDSFNCQKEVEQLKMENKKLEESCGLDRVQSKKFFNLNYDWDKLKQNYSLALRCLSFALNGSSHNEFRLYNEHLRNNDDRMVERIARDWINVLINKTFF